MNNFNEVLSDILQHDIESERTQTIKKELYENLRRWYESDDYRMMEREIKEVVDGIAGNISVNIRRYLIKVILRDHYEYMTDVNVKIFEIAHDYARDLRDDLVKYHDERFDKSFYEFMDKKRDTLRIINNNN